MVPKGGSNRAEFRIGYEPQDRKALGVDVPLTPWQHTE